MPAVDLYAYSFTMTVVTPVVYVTGATFVSAIKLALRLNDN